MKIKLMGAFIFSLLLSVPPLAMATIQKHTFNISGDTGETGTGSFTWDDATVPDGSILNGLPHILSPNVLSIHIEISGGSIIGGPIVFDKSDCNGAVLTNTPDFTNEINFWCYKAPYNMEGVDPSYAFVNGGPSTLALTFFPGVTAPDSGSGAAKVPTMPVYCLVLTMLGVLFVAACRLSSRATTEG